MKSVGLSAALLVALCCLHRSHAVLVTVDAVAEACFHDKVAQHTKMGLTFEVSEGGFLDIDVRVRSCLCLSRICVCCSIQTVFVLLSETEMMSYTRHLIVPKFKTC